MAWFACESRVREGAQPSPSRAGCWPRVARWGHLVYDLAMPTPPASPPPDDLDPNRPVRRWDLREARGFHAALRRRPWAALALAACCVGAAALAASGRLGESKARSDNTFRRHVLTGLWGAGALYFGAWAVIGWRERRRPPTEPPQR